MLKARLMVLAAYHQPERGVKYIAHDITLFIVLTLTELEQKFLFQVSAQ